MRPLRRSGHVDQSYLVTLKPARRALQHEVASIVRMSGDRLIFVNVKGTLAAPFLRPLVEIWEALPRLGGRHLGAFKAPAYCQ
jgi:hypothetical protein